MQQNIFGSNSFPVSLLGFGAGHIGGDNMGDGDALQVLEAAFDSGITLFDTARGYGLSEQRIGKFLPGKRDEIILSTKVGYSIDGYTDWTYDIIKAGIEHALKLMNTDYLDIVHLHSCDKNVLQNNGVADALVAAKQEGKIRVAAYSGENNELDFAIASDRFTSIQTSINIFDQRGIDAFCADARKKNMGVIAKRPMGNFAWIYESQPFGDYAEDYWLRMKAMELDFKDRWSEVALRFAAYHGNADSIIIGTGSAAHLKDNIKLLEMGSLTDEEVALIKETFKQRDDNWVGQI
jgi:aryl-alcohol dehydrogenase-like predicted oxidoreductase